MVVSTVKLPDVEIHPHVEGDGLPHFIEPVSESLRTDFAHVKSWFNEHQEALHRLAMEAGAIVLRGFSLTETRQFGELVASYQAPDFGYAGGGTPRKNIEGRVFEATNAPPDYRIPLHQEMAYLPQYPSRLAFFCKQPSETGGETIIGDMRRFYRELPSAFSQKVKDLGVLYQRNFRSPDWKTGEPVLDARHRPWTDAFDTTDKGEAQAVCEAMGLEFEWVNDSLTTWYRGQGVVTHPEAGEEVWFNQMLQAANHVYNYGPELMELYEAHYRNGPVRPYEIYYGDGSEIDIEDMEVAYPLFDEVTTAFPWQAGDVMIVDNFFTAHGRNPFTGERDIQVALLGGGAA